MIVIATGFITLSPLAVLSTKVMWESCKWLGKKIVRSTYRLNELQESLDRCTGRRDITEILLKVGSKQHTTKKSLNSYKTRFLWFHKILVI